jgi:TetR/AcrR family transcriptional repressor of bet genes
LLRIYQRRLHSNLIYDLRPLIGSRAGPAAQRIAGLIDGLYLRQGLARDGTGHLDATTQVSALLQAELRGGAQ